MSLGSVSSIIRAWNSSNVCQTRTRSFKNSWWKTKLIYKSKMRKPQPSLQMKRLKDQSNIRCKTNSSKILNFQTLATWSTNVFASIHRQLMSMKTLILVLALLMMKVFIAKISMICFRSLNNISNKSRSLQMNARLKWRPRRTTRATITTIAVTTMQAMLLNSSMRIWIFSLSRLMPSYCVAVTINHTRELKMW